MRFKRNTTPNPCVERYQLKLIDRETVVPTVKCAEGCKEIKRVYFFKDRDDPLTFSVDCQRPAEGARRWRTPFLPLCPLPRSRFLVCFIHPVTHQRVCSQTAFFCRLWKFWFVAYCKNVFRTLRRWFQFNNVPVGKDAWSCVLTQHEQRTEINFLKVWNLQHVFKLPNKRNLLFEPKTGAALIDKVKRRFA